MKLQFIVFTLDVIATSKEEQKVKNFRRYSKIRTAKFIISQQKSLRKSIKSSLEFAANKNPKKFYFSSKNNHILVEQKKRDENFNKKLSN